MARVGGKIGWQSSVTSSKIVGIVDPVTIPPGGPGEPPSNRPAQAHTIGHRTGCPRVAKEANANEEALVYPEPRAAVALSERSVRADAKAAASDPSGNTTQQLTSLAHSTGLTTSTTFTSPAYKYTSVTASSYPVPAPTEMVGALNLADPNRSHKPQGVLGKQKAAATKPLGQ
eukprot:m.10064 g.10064  ORF g.10064 m.10064 type:complete len:173 (-) comp2708_c0_seq1:221-739(-)